MSQPVIESRSYQQLVDDALARIPVHNPEYTNFNGSDPGVTMLEMFAFLAEAVAYRANTIPERNKQKFLDLLGIPGAPATSATGIVEIHNERGSLSVVTLDAGLELRAGQVPFRTLSGLVDADRFTEAGINFPALWTQPRFEGVLPRGTPVAQCFPVPRAPLELHAEGFSAEQATRYGALVAQVLEQPGVYRKRFRVKRAPRRPVP